MGLLLGLFDIYRCIYEVVCEETKSVCICSCILRGSGATHGLRASWWLLQHDLLRPLWRGPHGRPRLCEYHVELLKP